MALFIARCLACLLLLTRVALCGEPISIEAKIASLKTSLSSYEARRSDFLYGARLLPAEKYLQLLGQDKDALIAHAQSLALPSLDALFANDSGEKWSLDVRQAIGALLYIGDTQTLEKVGALWIERRELFSEGYSLNRVLAYCNQPAILLIYGKSLALSGASLDIPWDRRQELAQDAEFARRQREAYDTIRRISEFIGCSSELDAPQLPQAVIEWFQANWAPPEDADPLRKRWAMTFAWYAANRQALAEKRFNDLRPPAANLSDSVPAEKPIDSGQIPPAVASTANISLPAWIGLFALCAAIGLLLLRQKSSGK